MEPQKRRWLRVSEFAAAFGLHQRTVRKMLSRRQLAYVRRPGLGVRIDLDAYTAELKRYSIPVKGAGHGP